MRKSVIYRVDSPDWNVPEYKRTTLPKNSIWRGGNIPSNQVKTGVYINEIWYQPNANRFIGRFYSLWDNGKGECKGEFFVELTESEVKQTRLFNLINY